MSVLGYRLADQQQQWSRYDLALGIGVIWEKWWWLWHTGKLEEAANRWILHFSTGANDIFGGTMLCRTVAHRTRYVTCVWSGFLQMAHNACIKQRQPLFGELGWVQIKLSPTTCMLASLLLFPLWLGASSKPTLNAYHALQSSVISFKWPLCTWIGTGIRKSVLGSHQPRLMCPLNGKQISWTASATCTGVGASLEVWHSLLCSSKNLYYPSSSYTQKKLFIFDVYVTTCLA